MKIDFLKIIDKEQFYKKLIKYAKIILFLMLIFILAIVLINGSYRPLFFWIAFALAMTLAVNNAVKMWVAKRHVHKIICYVLDSFLLLFLTMASGSTYLPTIYMIILSEFYISEETIRSNVAMFLVSAVVYCVAYGVSAYLYGTQVFNIYRILAESFNSLIVLLVHFLIVNFAMLLYRHNVQMDEANQKLKTAYEELREVTVLQERQRIAKDIHDTAGHSITISIMQTEAAKMLLDTDPAQAKQNLIAANVQAKHALEELRECVHLLSGRETPTSLKESILSIVHDSSLGTGIKIRSDVEDIEIGGDKRRLIENTLKEGISNGIRHGGATAFYFELTKRGEKIYFLLSDNGKGVDMRKIRYGLGLDGLKKRADSLYGKAYFLSEVGEGFELHLELPIDKEEKHD